MNDVTHNLGKLFEQKFDVKPDTFVPLPISGSSRRYFRITSGDNSVIGAYNLIARENEAFVSFTEHFMKYGLPVPQVIAREPDSHIYLLSDLGNTTLLDKVVEKSNEESFPDDLLTIYKRVVEDLIGFQVIAGRSLDFSYCYPRKKFDKQAMLWDLNYFKYYFLKPSGVDFNEVELEKDFQRFVEFLSGANNEYFMYRDFQARNIMMVGDDPWYIDYQGGHKGALQYDLASLLFQAKAALPDEIRGILLNHYIDKLEKHIDIDKEQFKTFYFGFVLIRLIQVLGAYGFRGLFEGKAHFIRSIPLAFKNLNWFFDNVNIPVPLPELNQALKNTMLSDKFEIPVIKTENLTVNISSFSYKKGIPKDYSGNGGGFVFDCRALSNPGRIEDLRLFTGRDQEVIHYFEYKSEISDFLNNVFKLSGQSVKEYLKRGFKNLMISFGCTGGQHRSVYCSEKLAEYLNNNYDIHVILTHTEQKNWILK